MGNEKFIIYKWGIFIMGLIHTVAHRGPLAVQNTLPHAYVAAFLVRTVRPVAKSWFLMLFITPIHVNINPHAWMPHSTLWFLDEVTLKPLCIMKYLYIYI